MRQEPSDKARAPLDSSPDSDRDSSPPSAGESSTTVVIAFIANILVAVVKTGAALVTGSASMLAEAAHSWADAGNEVFLMIADRRANRKRDSNHPLGHGREAYVWSLFAAFGVFTIGAVVAIVNGIHELYAPEPATRVRLAYVVLGISFLLEGFSLVQSLVRARGIAVTFQRTTLDYLLNGSNTTLRAVVAEDAAALVGLLIAATGIGLQALTGNGAYDAVGSILIGILLAVVAIVLIDRNRRYLIGVSPPKATRRRVAKQILASPEIERITYLHLEFVGPSRLFLVAAVDLVGDAPEGQVARRLRSLEQWLEEEPLIQTAVLTLSVDDEPSLTF